MFRFTVIVLTTAIVASGCTRNSPPSSGSPSPVSTTVTPPFTRTNPFSQPSSLPFGAPRFDRIHDADYAPAIEEGMREQLAEVDAIADQTSAPTFENTIVALERSGELLTRVLKTFG